jgi:hypothetical protein
MSVLGNVFNKATRQSIPVYLTTSGRSFWRPTKIISQDSKDIAFSKTKTAFESGKLFKYDDMKNIASLSITYVAVRSVSVGVRLLIRDRRMPHESKKDRKTHCSIEAKNSRGAKVKGGHVQLDESRQTVSNHLPLFVIPLR